MGHPVIYMVDDEPEILEMLKSFLKDIKVDVKTFTKPEQFLESFDGSRQGCLILDIQMPGLSGVQVLQKIRGWLPVYPVIFISAHADVPITVNVMKEGAFDLLQKPFNYDEFLKRVNAALEWSQNLHEKHSEASAVWAGMQNLTSREREIMDLLLAGLSSREIAERLDISRFTVDHHRAHILDKVKCSSLSGLTSAVAKAKTLFESGNGLKLGPSSTT